MILPVNNLNTKVQFSADANGGDKKKPLEYDHDTLLKNNLMTRTRIGMDKLTNAFTLYPAKGLKGSRNANFYEFLTMGTVPYLIGSATLMAVFNTNKVFPHFDKTVAKPLGRKMALGVIFYALAKNLSKSFVSTPIKMMTGIDIERPYAKVIYELPDDVNDTDITSIEYHKVFESVEFPRWDLLYGDETKGQKRNFRYDRIAKKLGMGQNLNDSDQEVKSRIKEIVIKAGLAKNISSYLWAAVGVCMAVQKPWEKYFDYMTFKFWKKDEFLKSMKVFGESFVKSAKDFYKGEGKGISKHAGKILLGVAALSSIVGTSFALSTSNKPSKIDSADIIKKDDRYVVN